MSNGPDTGTELVLGERRLKMDADGHLHDPAQWDPAVAAALARRDGIELSPDQWWLIEFVRHHHQTYATPPLMRVVVAAYRAYRQNDRLTSRDIYLLFADHPVRRACLYGGLPKPDWCI